MLPPSEGRRLLSATQSMRFPHVLGVIFANCSRTASGTGTKLRPWLAVAAGEIRWKFQNFTAFRSGDNSNITQTEALDNGCRLFAACCSPVDLSAAAAAGCLHPTIHSHTGCAAAAARASERANERGRLLRYVTRRCAPSSLLSMAAGADSSPIGAAAGSRARPSDRRVDYCCCCCSLGKTMTHRSNPRPRAQSSLDCV